MKRVLISATLLALAACSSFPDGKAEPDEKTYSEIFPYYTELCAESEINKTADFGAAIESGGPGGHSLLYLSGVCRDTSAGYPVLKLCDDTTPKDLQGVGLSVNDHFKNANWVATPGREFFFHGTLRPGERLTRDVYQSTEAKAEQFGIYDGVEFHDEVFQGMPPEMSRRDFSYDVSIGTDFAPDFARNRLCARAPVSKAQMQAAVDYLNGRNAPYRSGEKEFHWDVLRNNCTHMTHDVVAAADVWDTWPRNDSLALAALDFPVPKNEFINLMRRTNDTDLSDLDALYGDKTVRDGLMQYGFLPDEPGALAEFSPVTAQNDVYSTHSRLIFFDEAIFGTYQPWQDKIFSDPRYTDLRVNLLYFSTLYGRLQRERRPVESYRTYHDGGEQTGFDAFYAAYWAYIERMKQKTDDDLDLIDGIAAPERDAVR